MHLAHVLLCYSLLLSSVLRPLALALPDFTLRARLDALRPTKFQPDSDQQMLACQAQVAKNGDFYGPWLAVP